MKKRLKIIICVILVIMIFWGIIFFIDYSRCKDFKEPVFVVAGEMVEDTCTGVYYGLGYKVEVEKTAPDADEDELVKVEMYMFDKFVAGAIADEDNTEGESEQYEFVATIIEAYDNYIIVEPEEESNERKSSDKISMKITRPTNGTNDFYVVGNKVKITYDGNIMESYPAQIGAIKIELAQ